ncbi:hypothetical protein ACFQHO_15115 [Actinomadura yumaensis]|uniref:hypothetical protein n=1 Tax=Actinomadura yumaensis TaxID=111807 RepID=UPI00360E8725
MDDPAAARAGAGLGKRLAGEEGVVNVASYWDGRAPQLKGKRGDKALVVATIRGTTPPSRNGSNGSPGRTRGSATGWR